MNRDNTRSTEYFEKYIAYEDRRIGMFKEKLEKISKDDNSGFKRCNGYLAGFYKNKMTAMYSAGYSKDEIKKVFVCYLNHILVSGIESYSEMIDILALEILFDCNLEISNKYQDTLTDILATFIRDKSIKKVTEIKLNYPDKYNIYLDLLYDDNNDSVVQHLTHFFANDWYELNNDMSWYNSHNSKHDTYAGYWSWIGAAIAKMKEIQIKGIEHCKYLPVDLLY